MKSFIVLIVLLFITTSVYSTEVRNYYESREFAWDCFHVVSSGFGTIYINHIFKLKWYESAMLVMTCGVVWEICDELYQDRIIRGNFDSILDKGKGFNYKDLLRNGIGVGISFPIRLKW
jgi:hypothetical protein